MEQEQLSYRLKVKVSKVLFYKADSMWGIVSVKPTTFPEAFDGNLNAWGCIVVRGSIPHQPQPEQELDLEISTLKHDPKYGEFHEIVRVYMEALLTVESHQNFIRAILTEYQANKIIETFPNSLLVDDIKNNIINLESIRGFGGTTVEKIIAAIEKNKDMGNLMAEVADLGLTGNMLNKVVKHFGDDSTRAYFSVKQSLYNLCAVSGISFKRVDEVALKRGEDKFGAKRINAYAEYYFDEIANEGHSWVDERIFIEKAITDLDVNGKYIRDYMTSDDGVDSFYWQQDDKRISSKRMYNNEFNTLKHLLRLSTMYSPPADIDYEEAITKAEENLSVNYTAEQKKAILECLKYGVFVLNGRGGTGKTTAVKGIVEVLESAGLTCQACALSGKAANVLASKGISSATIHRTFGIGINERVKDDLEKASADVYVVDESSMVNAQLFAVLLSKIQDGSKIIIVGDSGQLSAIGHGDVLRDLLQTQYFPTVELIQIHRQAQDSGIIDVASKIRDGEQICHAGLNGKQVYGVNKDMIMMGYADKELIAQDLRKVLVGQSKNIKTAKDLMDYQVVVAMRDRGDLSAKAVNNLAQSVFNDLGKESIPNGGYEYREGDKVIVRGNSYDITYFDDMDHYMDFQNNGRTPEEINFELSYMSTPEEREQFLEDQVHSKVGDLFNGTMGIILHVDKEYNVKAKKDIQYAVIEFEGLGVVKLLQPEMDMLDLAYAVTCHRLQGSTIKNVVVVLDYGAYALLSRQWVYTAITRASKKCVLMVQSAALVKAISTDASGKRQTFLGDSIRGLSRSRGTLQQIVDEQRKKLDVSTENESA